MIGGLLFLIAVVVSIAGAIARERTGRARRSAGFWVLGTAFVEVILAVVLLFQEGDRCPSEDPRVAAVLGVVVGTLLIPGGVGLLRDPGPQGSEDESPEEHRIETAVGYPGYRCSCGQGFTTQEAAASHVEAVTA